MLYIKLLNCINSSKSFDLAIDLIELSGSLEHALPGILIVTGHIVVCMVTCNNHKRTKNNLLEACIFYFVDYNIASGIFRLTLYSTDECVCKSKLLHLCLHLVVCNICCVRGSVSHEYGCGSILSSSFHAVISCALYSCICNCLCNSSLVFVDSSSV